MKLLRLDLIAFGPFTNVQIDLSDGQHGLHIVYGPNEAGKSSSLRAIADLLYGFHPRTPDDFIHGYKRLRIGGELQHSDGSTLEFVRRKANKKSLFAVDDTTAMDESELTRFVGEVDRELFQMMFGIDHERLRRGGEEIVKGDGRIGELLFAAGAGLAGLQKVQTQLREEMDVLLKTSGRSGTIAKDVNRFQESRSEVKKTQVSVETWKRHDENLQAAQKRKEVLDESIRQNRSEHNRLTRIRDAVSAIGQWKKAKDDLAKVVDTPLLPENFEKESHEILIELRKTEQQREDAEASLKKIESDLRHVVVPGQLLQESDATDSIQLRLGGYNKAMKDRPKLELSRQLVEEEAKEILRELGHTPDLSGIEELRLPTDKTIRIQNLGNQQEGLIERLESSRRECEKCRRAIARIEGSIEQIRIPPGASSLRATVRDIQDEGDVESQLDSVINELNELKANTQVALSQLGLWSGSLDEAEKLAVPSLATIEQFAEEFKDRRGQLALHRDRLREKIAEKERLDAELGHLERGQRIPTDEELNNARKLRESGWQLVLRSWMDDSENEAEVENFLRGFPPATTLADAYHRSVENADQLVDQLRTDAERVANKVKLQSDRDRRLAEKQNIEAEIQLSETDCRDVEQRWKESWKRLSINPLSPLEMRDWCRKQQEIANAAANLRAKQLDADQFESRVDTMIGELTTAIVAVDPTYAAEKKSLRNLLRFAVGKCEEIQKSENLLEQLVVDLESNRNDLSDAESRCTESKSALSKWQSDWAAEMSGLGLQSDALPSQANSVLADINRLFQKLQEADDFRLRLEGIDRDAREFEEDVRELAGRTLPDLAEKPAEDAVGQLASELKVARLSAEKRAALIQQRDEQTHKLQQATERISEFKASLDEMCRQAGIRSYDQLSEAANKSRQRRDLEQAVAKLEELISSQSGGAEFKTFVAEAEREVDDIDSLQPRIDELSDCLERLGTERDEVLGQIRDESLELRQIDGSAAASEKAAISESIAAHLEDQVQELAKLRLSSAILYAAIEEHRKRNQGPVLSRASEIFNQITIGMFRELRADFNERGEPVLTGVRTSSGEPVPVSGMSDGTCDQLYLALRLASLEPWLERHEPIPFIVDDVLLNFDDARAIASLQVLAELSQRTQVIFFTHHKHLVDMAQHGLPGDQIFVTTCASE